MITGTAPFISGPLPSGSRKTLVAGVAVSIFIHAAVFFVPLLLASLLSIPASPSKPADVQFVFFAPAVEPPASKSPSRAGGLSQEPAPMDRPVASARAPLVSDTSGAELWLISDTEEVLAALRHWRGRWGVTEGPPHRILTRQLDLDGRSLNLESETRDGYWSLQCVDPGIRDRLGVRDTREELFALFPPEVGEQVEAGIVSALDALGAAGEVRVTGAAYRFDPERNYEASVPVDSVAWSAASRMAKTIANR